MNQTIRTKTLNDFMEQFQNGPTTANYFYKALERLEGTKNIDDRSLRTAILHNFMESALGREHTEPPIQSILKTKQKLPKKSQIDILKGQYIKSLS